MQQSCKMISDIRTKTQGQKDKMEYGGIEEELKGEKRVI